MLVHGQVALDDPMNFGVVGLDDTFDPAALADNHRFRHNIGFEYPINIQLTAVADLA